MMEMSGAARPVRERINLLSGWIESEMAYRDQPGLAIGIVHDQALMWSRGFGYANLATGEPVTPETLFRIASITKLFTSTAVLQLRDAGLLQLDDPVQKHLPWFQLKPAATEMPPVTIRQLITHTSGLPREAPFPYWTDAEFPTMSAIRGKLPAVPAALPPETSWKYSNLALALAGEVVSAVSGQDYAEYITAHVLEPLGMSRTLVRTPESDHSGLATGYGRRLPRQGRALSPETNAQGLTPAFNMASSVADLARFLMLQMRNTDAHAVEEPGQILAPRTLREMQRVHWLEPDWKNGAGLGFAIVREKGRTWVGHGGAVLGHRTLLGFLPAERVGVVVLTNADDGDPMVYAQRALDWLAPPLVKTEVEKATPAEGEHDWSVYEGKYRNAWRDIQVQVLDGKLTMIDIRLPDPLAFIATIERESEHVFRMTKAHGGWVLGELVVFEFAEVGAISRLKMGENYLSPVERW